MHKVDSIKKLKHQLESIDIPKLSDDFNIKLQVRINKDNYKNHFRKLLPIAASVALIAPLTYFLTINPQEEVQNDFIVELLSAGNSINNDYEGFHKWTQIDDTNEGLACGNSLSTNHCSLELSNVPSSS